MTATTPDWRVAVKAGDVLSTTATYDSERASWYESMGIMVAWMADGNDGRDPFEEASTSRACSPTATCPRTTTTAGSPVRRLRRPAQAPVAEGPGHVIPIDNFVYARGDLTVADSVPTVSPGQAITFDNTSTRRSPTASGTRSPLAGAVRPLDRHRVPARRRDVTFDSGELGIAGPPDGRPADVGHADRPGPGTYTYFCRIHPSMRGAFRVTDS